VSQILAPSISEMMMSETSSHGGDQGGYANDAKQETSSAGYGDDTHPVHSIGLNNAYGYYYGAAAH
jgi:hypothetical protein